MSCPGSDGANRRTERLLRFQWRKRVSRMCVLHLFGFFMSLIQLADVSDIRAVSVATIFVWDDFQRL